jgi:hypothetical protein
MSLLSKLERLIGLEKKRRRKPRRKTERRRRKANGEFKKR